MSNAGRRSGASGSPWTGKIGGGQHTSGRRRQGDGYTIHTDEHRPAAIEVDVTQQPAVERRTNPGRLGVGLLDVR